MNEQKKTGLNRPANLLPSRPEAEKIHCLLLTAWFSVPWHKSPSSLALLEQILRNVSRNDFSVAPDCVGHKMDLSSNPFPPPLPTPNENQEAKAELNPSKWEWGITKDHPQIQGEREEPKKSDWRLSLQSSLHSLERAPGMWRW